MTLDDLRIKIFADGADLAAIGALARNPRVRGFTTNPTLMRKAGVADFETFARAALETVAGRPISFEVLSDDFGEMERQAHAIASWGDNVYVKIPVTDTHGRSSAPVIARLAHAGVKLNVTAIMTAAQVDTVAVALAGGPSAFVSVFAGRIADSGRDPVPVMRSALASLAPHPQIELIWASPRELLNAVQADAAGVHVITMTVELLDKLVNIGKGLEEFSLETVQMFDADARLAGYSL